MMLSVRLITTPLRLFLRPACRLSLVAGLLQISLVPSSIADLPLPSAARASTETRVNPVTVLYELLDQCPADLPELKKWEIAGAIHHESQKHGFDPLFVLAMIEIESGCLPTARGSHGSLGLLQMTPNTAEAVAEGANVEGFRNARLTTPALSIQLGLHYLAELEKKFGDRRVALAAYNMGPSHVGQMPRAKARNARYVRSIMGRYEEILSDPIARQI